MSPNVILLVVVGVLVLALMVWFLAASRRTQVDLEVRPADEPVRRNQALIDASPVAATATQIMPQMPDLMPADPDVAAPAALIDEALSDNDDLTQIKGVGPKLADLLRTLGVTSFAQIAEWDEDQIDRIDGQLGRFQGRIRQDDWPAQARLLAAGDTAGYEVQFGRL